MGTVLTIQDLPILGCLHSNPINFCFDHLVCSGDEYGLDDFKIITIEKKDSSLRFNKSELMLPKDA